MQPMHFDQSVRNILKKDSRFQKEAYEFLKQALDHTVSEHEKSNPNQDQHVTAAELLIGFRDLALKEYGPMASTLLDEWGITTCQHIGDMVFLLIEEGMFGKQDSDSHSDFTEIYDFNTTFIQPFLPKTLQKKLPQV